MKSASAQALSAPDAKLGSAGAAPDSRSVAHTTSICASTGSPSPPSDGPSRSSSIAARSSSHASSRA